MGLQKAVDDGGEGQRGVGRVHAQPGAIGAVHFDLQAAQPLRLDRLLWHFDKAGGGGGMWRPLRRRCALAFGDLFLEVADP